MFAESELYGLTLQIRRAAVSTPANIAEGFKKRGRADKARFMNIAQGIFRRNALLLILARDLGYLDSHNLLSQLEEVSRLLEAYNRTILASSS